METILFWFRRDLRIHDNVGLRRARDNADKLYPVFVVDPNHAGWSHRNGDRLQFKLDCVTSLAQTVKDSGKKLIRRHGNYGEELLELCERLDVDAVYWNRAYEPYERERDGRVRKTLENAGLVVKTFKDQVLFEKQEITTSKDEPYKVFTPYSKRWKATGKRTSVEPVRQFEKSNRVKQRSCPAVSDMDLDQSLDDHDWPASETSARKRWDDFLSGPIEKYDKNRDQPARKNTSRLSPYIRFGLLSVREMYWDCRERFDDVGRAQGIETFVDELIWRDFYHQILWNFPRVADGNFHEKYDDLTWEWDEELFEAWKHGRTGYPIVDASMRQLNRTGWMHNQLRMIVASFLTKDLLIHWKHGERYFMNQLLDGDTAANNGGWQWAASTGTDAVPYFRIFNPVSQSRKYDPDATFIRRYCPELSSLPAEYIHAPFEMDAELREQSGIELGEDYPEPIVDHSYARERAIERFKSIT